MVNTIKTLDEINVNIIKYLQSDAKTSYRELEEKLGISIGTIHNRVKLLRENGLRFTVNIDWNKLIKEDDFVVYFSILLNQLISEFELYSKKGLESVIRDLTNKVDIFIAKNNLVERIDILADLMEIKSEDDESE
jgi:DNA-binding Lrp family transcriptional regulator